MTEQVQLLPIAQVKVHPLNRRRDVGDVTELAESIRANGVLQPAIAVRNGEGWLIVAGSRRLAASKKAGRETIPAIVRDMSDADIAAAAAIENLQRADLQPLEEAEAYRVVLQTINPDTKKPWSQTELGKKLGRDQSTISNALRLLAAPAPVKEALREKRITPAHARVALELKDPGLATKLPLREGVTVDILKIAVNSANETYETKGAGAVAALKKALADAQARHPKATITWEAGGRYDIANISAALGRSPARIAGRIGEFSGVTAKQHDKKCQCQAYMLEARRSWSGAARLVVEEQRVCIDAKGYAAARPKPRKQKAAAVRKAKEPTPAQKARAEAKAEEAERKLGEEQLKRHFALPKFSAAAATVFAKLRKAKLPADVTRAILANEVAFDIGHRGDDFALKAWDRILKMPAKTASTLAIAKLVNLMQDEVLRGVLEADQFEGRVAAYFGVKVAAAKAPKPKKKAKR